ncbi:uncharacterized protein PG998_010839 [Apiospora kogelbergensis]|uniref:Uncharacterized protein n=1 Tax=Apiospora kogelbergensis TaxID=1337665 RepID=A0AAW0RDL5_9PEZI
MARPTSEAIVRSNVLTFHNATVPIVLHFDVRFSRVTMDTSPGFQEGIDHVAIFEEHSVV